MNGQVNVISHAGFLEDLIQSLAESQGVILEHSKHLVT